MENAYATEIRIRFYDEDVDIRDLFNKIQNLRAKDYLKLYQMMYQDLIEHQKTNYFELEGDKKIKKIQRLNQDNFQCVSNLEVSGQSANYFEYGIEDEIRDIVDKINEIIDYLMENNK